MAPVREGWWCVRAGLHSWVGGANMAPGSGLWPRTIHRWGDQGLVMVLVLQGLIEGHLLYAPDWR